MSLSDLLKFGDCAGCGTTRQDILCSPTLPEQELTPLRLKGDGTGSGSERVLFAEEERNERHVPLRERVHFLRICFCVNSVAVWDEDLSSCLTQFCVNS